MSANDKVKVLWKTNCNWRDHAHWPKRKEIKLARDGSEETEGILLPLNPGDAVKIKFGSRWYNAEVAESWMPKSKKGAAKKSRQADSSQPANESNDPTPTAQDPYQKFLAEQQKREREWKTMRAVKKARTQDTICDQSAATADHVDDNSEPSTDQAAQISELKKRLEAKDEECRQLQDQLKTSEKAKEEALRQQMKANELNEDFRKVMARMQNCLEAIEVKMESNFSRLDARLESLEARTTNPSNDSNMFCSPLEYDAPEIAATSTMDLETELAAHSSLSTIDVEVLRQVCEGTPRTPEQSSQQSVLSTPQAPSPNTLTETELEVREGLIRTCVTPRKVKVVKQTLDKAKQTDKCALKLLPLFFNKEELSSCNTDGSHGKGSLDATRLNNLKILVFTKFPFYSPSEKDKIWRGIKSKINSKCRTTKFACLKEFPVARPQ